MEERFEHWRSELDRFQRRRASGAVSDPQKELDELAAKVDSLAADGLDVRATALVMVQLERACVLVESRDFDAAYRLAADCRPSSLLPASACGFVTSTRELVFGNVLLLRDGDAAGTAPSW